jgi:hypothetical protein
MLKKLLVWISKIGLFILKNPVNVLCAVVFLFFAAKRYLFNGDMTDQLIMLGAVALWVVWFLATHILLLVFAVLLLGGIWYGYYTHYQRLKAECEQSGGEWHADLKVCEEKVSLAQKTKKIAKKMATEALKQFSSFFADETKEKEDKPAKDNSETHSNTD